MAGEPEGEKSEQRLVRVRRRRGAKGVEAEAAERAPVPVPELHTPFDEVPPEETDPARRTRPTIGLVELTADGRESLGLALDVPGVDTPVEDRSDGLWRTFDDLMGAFPIGGVEGEYYINVERRAPVTYMGYSTRGVLRKITERLTLEEFTALYGGGTYDLIVYGPPKRAGVMDDITGRPRPKALSKPVRVVIPWHAQGGHPPNPEAAFPREEEESDEDNMDSGGNGYAGLPGKMLRNGVTPAAAQVVGHHFKHQETMDTRQREDRRERRRDEERRETTAAELVDRAADRTTTLLRDQNAELARQVRELTQARSSKGSDLDGMASVLREVMPKTPTSELADLRDAHRREVETLVRTHRDELETINRRNSEDLARREQQQTAAIERAEGRANDTARQCNERIKDIEERMERELQRAKDDVARVKQELRADADRELTYARAEHGRQMEAQRVTHETLMNSERRQAEREVQTKEQIAASQIATQAATQKMELDAARAELKRRDREVDRLTELAAKHGDLGKMMEEGRKIAEQLGYAPGNEGGEEEKPADIKTLLTTALVEGIKNFPQIIQSAGNAAAALRRPPPAALAPPEVRQQQPTFAGYQPPMRTFASEASGMEPQSTPSFNFPPAQGTPTPQMPPPMMAPQPVTAFVADQGQPQQQAPAQQAMRPVAPPQQASFGPSPGQPLAVIAQGAPTQFAPLGQPQSPAAPPAMPTQAEQEYNAEVERLIMMGVPQLETAFEGNVPPAEISKFLFASQGADAVKAHLATLKPETIATAIGRSGRQSRLITRAGRKYLRAIEAAVLETLNGAPS